MNMRTVLFFAIFTICIKCTLNIKSPTDDNMQERLAILKQKLTEDLLHNNQFSVIPIMNDVDPLGPKSIRNGRITPVSLHKKKKKRRTTTRRTTRTTSKRRHHVRNSTRSRHIRPSKRPPRPKHIKSRMEKWAKHVKRYGKPREIFYRRENWNGLSEAEIRKRHAMLCVDLLRPVLAGLKKNATVTKIVGDQTANRLIELLSYGGANAPPEEIESLLYQINSLHLRFFQWEVGAIKKLFNFIMPGQRHSFKSIKYGVKKLFDMWQMDLSDTNRLIKESRMFRPPCIGTTQGSTRSSKNTQYTKPATPKTTCAPKDKKCLKYESANSQGSYEY
ncbi:uncharacterized protein LOC128682091 [Plodia interpunctella]|uniref:uncharacterized protein LOC128682091 n=1 Tax=Plodia interpunctella TaxID=58824 RepID=UPI002368DD01|nr:uncharacterized protein LOC128682091 [Plodia interpunctella]